MTILTETEVRFHVANALDTVLTTFEDLSEIEHVEHENGVWTLWIENEVAGAEFQFELLDAPFDLTIACHAIETAESDWQDVIHDCRVKDRFTHWQETCCG